MKKIIYFAMLFCAFFFSDFIFAQTPRITTLSPVGISQSAAHLRVQFDSNKYSYQTGSPSVWFRYGLSTDDLSRETMKLGRIAGEYIISEKVSGLKSGTRYYYESVMSVDGNISFGERKSFVTEKGAVSQGNEKTSSSGNNGFLTPEEMLQQYYKDTSPQEKSETSNSGSGGSTSSQAKAFSWREFFGFGSKEKEKTTENSLLVNDPSVLNNQAADKEVAIDHKKDNSQEERKKQEFNKKSAAHDDELGEVIEFNYDTGYKNKYKNNYRSPVKKRSTLNYPALLLILILLLVVVVLIYLTLHKRKKIMHAQVGSQPTGGPRTPRYHIPIKRNVHDPRQNPNKTFFRNPPKK